MTELKFRLECERCRRGFLVTYDADVPTRLLSIQCKCGHVTPIRQADPFERPILRFADNGADSARASNE